MAESLITQVSQSQAQSFKNNKKPENNNALKLNLNQKKPPSKPSLSLPIKPAAPEETVQRDQFGINSPRGGPEEKLIKPEPAPAESELKTKKEGNCESKTDINIVGKEGEKKSAASSESYLNPPGKSPVDQESDSEEVESEPEPEPEPEEIKLKAPWTMNELLPPLISKWKGKKCLILDLDETLVHSSFHSVDCDFEIPVDIEGIVRTIYVAKRPHVDEFMKACGELFEVVVFTASLAKYADPLLDLLDIHKVIDHRLFRESCTPHNGAYVKDLYRIGRPLTQSIIIDNSPHSYAFNPQNAIPCESWFDDRSDTELLLLLEILRRLADPSVEDVMKEMEALEVSANSSSLGYPYETDYVPLPDTVNETDGEEEEVIPGDNESDGGEEGQDSQWKIS
jgi:RNA polymerase II subunit A small phosphatase-like protein